MIDAARSGMDARDRSVLSSSEVAFCERHVGICTSSAPVHDAFCGPDGILKSDPGCGSPAHPIVDVVISDLFQSCVAVCHICKTGTGSPLTGSPARAATRCAPFQARNGAATAHAVLRS